MDLTERMYSVLLVSAAEKFNDELIGLLPAAAFDTVKTAVSVSAARRQLAEHDYDIVIINSPLPDDVGVRFAIDASDQPGTVALLIVRSEQEGELYARVSVHGVFTMAKPMSRSSVRMAIQWMISARERIRGLEKKTRSVDEKMKEIRLVNRAKWILISHLKMDESGAHRFIEKQAMDRCMTRREVAEDIIKTYS